MIIREYRDGVAMCGDSTDQNTVDVVKSYTGQVGLIVTDPPYGNIVDEKWDQMFDTDTLFASWMIKWTRKWTELLLPGGAFYVWGGTGRPGFRPFFKYLTEAEIPGEFELANLITWKKRRAYGLKYNYLFTREECAYFVKGDTKKPRMFNIPLLEEKRGYAGYNKKYPAKSEFYRRTNVWTDVNEIFKGKLHPTQKAQRVIEVPIEVHTVPGEYVIDPFAGSGTTALAARKLGRKFVVIEDDPIQYRKMCELLDR